MSKVAVAAVAANPAATPPTPGYPAYTARFQSKAAERSFMLGFEGYAEAGGMFPANTLLRGFAFRAENTANSTMPYRWKELDAVVRPDATLECTREVVSKFNLVDTGISMTTIEQAERKIIELEIPAAA